MPAPALATHGARSPRFADAAPRGRREREPPRPWRSAPSVPCGSSLRADGGSRPGAPAPSTQCTDAQLYLPANPDALGDSDFLYRAYIDLRQDSPTHGVVVVRKDGTLVRVEPGADGSYSYLGSTIGFTDMPTDMPDEFRQQALVADFFASGGGGADWDGVSPATRDYEWTVDVPAGAPAGVDTAQLSSSLRVAMGLGGSGYDSSFVPDGAVTDEIITTTAGGTDVSRVAYGGPSNSQDTSKDVASIALRVSNLPGGGTYTLTATHHSVDPALNACASSTSSSVSATVTGTPSPAATNVLPGSSPDPGISQGGVPVGLAGPESAVFACGAPLPTELEGTLGLAITWESGVKRYSSISGGPAFSQDFGPGGVAALGALARGGAPGAEPTDPSWASNYTDTESLAVFSAVAAVKDGVLVGVVRCGRDGAGRSYPRGHLQVPRRINRRGSDVRLVDCRRCGRADEAV